MEAKDFLEEIDYYNTNVDGEQFEDLGIETLADMLEVYHQKKLKLLGIGVVMPCFEFSSTATKYKQNADEDIVAVDTDGIALQNDNLPNRAYTLEEGVKYTVKLYKA